jgi:hypothetical protein
LFQSKLKPLVLAERSKSTTSIALLALSAWRSEHSIRLRKKEGPGSTPAMNKVFQGKHSNDFVYD